MLGDIVPALRDIQHFALYSSYSGLLNSFANFSSFSRLWSSIEQVKLGVSGDWQTSDRKNFLAFTEFSRFTSCCCAIAMTKIMI